MWFMPSDFAGSGWGSLSCSGSKRRKRRGFANCSVNSLIEDPARRGRSKLFFPEPEHHFGAQTEQGIFQRDQVLTHLAELEFVFLLVERHEFANCRYIAF